MPGSGQFAALSCKIPCANTNGVNLPPHKREDARDEAEPAKLQPRGHEWLNHWPQLTYFTLEVPCMNMSSPRGCCWWVFSQRGGTSSATASIKPLLSSSSTNSEAKKKKFI